MQIYAAKVSINTIEENSPEFLKISREVNIISKLNHPSVLKFIFYSPINFKMKHKPVIITEFASNGTLADLIKSKRNSKQDNNDILNDTQKLIIIYGIAKAMSYLHFHDILHRDLKPANILLDKYLFPKIADFGLSKVYYQNTDLISQNNANNRKGTPAYISPEIWSNSEYSKKSDVYAFGIIVYEIITNEKPFGSLPLFCLFQKVVNGFRPEFTNPINKAYKKFILNCWAQEPTDRPTFDSIVNQLKTNRDFITESVNEEEYFNYIRSIENCKTSFKNSKENVFYFNFKQDLSQQHIKQIADNKIKLLSYREFIKLDDECKKLVNQAEENPSIQFLFGKSLIDGLNQFPLNTELGIKYLQKSIDNGYVESLIYYCKMLIKGKIIPQNLDEAKDLIKNHLNEEDSTFLYLKGKILQKENKNEEAIQCFQKSLNLGNGYSMYEYGKMLFRGKGCQMNRTEAIKYFEKAIDKDCLQAMDFYGFILMLSSEEEGLKYIKMAADKGNLRSMCNYINELDDKSQEYQHYLKMAAFNGDPESMYLYAYELYLKMDVLSLIMFQVIFGKNLVIKVIQIRCFFMDYP